MSHIAPDTFIPIMVSFLLKISSFLSKLNLKIFLVLFSQLEYCKVLLFFFSIK